MQAEPKYNFVCRSCDAKLLCYRRSVAFSSGRPRTCPYCMENVPPRDTADLIQYHLVQRPAPPPSFVPSGLGTQKNPHPSNT